MPAVPPPLKWQPLRFLWPGSDRFPLSRYSDLPLLASPPESQHERRDLLDELRMDGKRGIAIGLQLQGSIRGHLFEDMIHALDQRQLRRRPGLREKLRVLHANLDVEWVSLFDENRLFERGDLRRRIGRRGTKRSGPGLDARTEQSRKSSGNHDPRRIRSSFSVRQAFEDLIRLVLRDRAARP